MEGMDGLRRTGKQMQTVFLFLVSKSTGDVVNCCSTLMSMKISTRGVGCVLGAGAGAGAGGSCVDKQFMLIWVDEEGDKACWDDEEQCVYVVAVVQEPNRGEAQTAFFRKKQLLIVYIQEREREVAAAVVKPGKTNRFVEHKIGTFLLAHNKDCA